MRKQSALDKLNLVLLLLSDVENELTKDTIKDEETLDLVIALENALDLVGEAYEALQN